MSILFKYFFEIYLSYQIKYYICVMKRTILTVDIDPELKQHLEKQADRKKVSLSRYVRAALKKASKYKERELV